MKIGFLIDPISTLNPRKDTTIAMINSACKRGHNCSYFTPEDLICQSEGSRVFATPIEIGDISSSHWAITGAQSSILLSSFDIIVMRKDPPFNLEYIYLTYALELAEKSGVVVANNPQSLRDANEKFFTLQFPQCCPPTLVSRNSAVLRNFWQENKNTIFKPLTGMGGSEVFHVNEQGLNLSVILEVLTKNNTVSVMAQQYLPAIRVSGDKRILLINGEPIDYGLARIPAAGELRGNLAAGALGRVVSLTARDRWLCEQIAPSLREKELYFVGIDVIGDYITEINVTSPTCAREIMKETSIDISGQYIDFLVNLAKIKLTPGLV